MTNEERSELFEAAVNYYMSDGEDSLDQFPAWLIHVSVNDDSIETEYEARRWLKAHERAIQSTMTKMREVLKYAKDNTSFEEKDTQVAGVHYHETVIPMNGKHKGDYPEKTDWQVFRR